MSDRTLRIGIVGCGPRGVDHAAAWRDIAGVECVACADHHEASRTALATRFGLRAYRDAAEMLAAETLDVVQIVTRPQSRLALMRLVADAGIPACTVEKPVAIGVADWRALVALESEVSTRFAVCHQVRWQPNLARGIAAIRAGELGDIDLIEMTAGMNLAGQGTHVLHYGSALAGDAPIARVCGSVYGWDGSQPAHPAPVGSEATITWANGQRGLWVTGPGAPRCGDPATHYQHVRLAAYGRNGRFLYEEFGQWDLQRAGHPSVGDRLAHDARWATGNHLAQKGFQQSVANWLRDESHPSPTNLARTLHEWSVVLALYQSALERRPIDMASFDPPDDLIERICD